MHVANFKVAVQVLDHVSGLICTWLRWYSRERRMASRLLALLTLMLLVRSGEGRCGERLERALDMMQQRGNAARRKYDPDSADLVYHQRLHTAPIDVSVAKIIVEIPVSNGRDGLSWAKVERCSYEPNNNSIRTRVGFSELAVSGLVQLRPLEAEGAAKEQRIPLPAESCRMSLRLRRAGMEFYTSPIARGRGQMRIRTESSFLEPRFASIYAYGCRPAFAAPQQPPPPPYDRVESEPRKREIDDHTKSASEDSNSVSNEGNGEEDAVKEENRLGDSVAPLTADAMLDTLWRSRGDIAREMEDVFLRSASQAITHYIERQLHPAIKETLMLSMGYTISYG